MSADLGVDESTRDESSQDGQDQRPMRGTFLVFASITSQTAVITGLLYYIGWVRTEATFEYYGIDPGLLGFDPPDYILRSLGSSFPPLVVLALVAVVVFWVHRRFTPSQPAPGAAPPSMWLIRLCQVLALLLGAAVVVGLVAQREVGVPLGIGLPVLLVAAVAAFGYAELMDTRRRRLLLRERHHPPQLSLLVAVLLGLGALGLLWGLALYANQVGEDRAKAYVASLPSQPDIAVYSVQRLGISGPGVELATIEQEGNKYKFVYNGLRMLARTGDQYMLLPVGWQKGRDAVFFIRASEDIRIDVTAPPSPIG